MMISLPLGTARDQDFTAHCEDCGHFHKCELCPCKTPCPNPKESCGDRRCCH